MWYEWRRIKRIRDNERVKTRIEFGTLLMKTHNDSVMYIILYNLYAKNIFFIKRKRDTSMSSMYVHKILNLSLLFYFIFYIHFNKNLNDY